MGAEARVGVRGYRDCLQGSDVVDVPREHLRGIGGYPQAAPAGEHHVRQRQRLVRQVHARDEDARERHQGVHGVAARSNPGRRQRHARQVRRHGRKAGKNPKEPGELPREEAPAVPPLLLHLQRRLTGDLGPGQEPAERATALQGYVRGHQEARDDQARNRRAENFRVNRHALPRRRNHSVQRTGHHRRTPGGVAQRRRGCDVRRVQEVAVRYADAQQRDEKRGLGPRVSGSDDHQRGLHGVDHRMRKGAVRPGHRQDSRAHPKEEVGQLPVQARHPHTVQARQGEQEKSRRFDHHRGSRPRLNRQTREMRLQSPDGLRVGLATPVLLGPGTGRLRGQAGALRLFVRVRVPRQQRAAGGDAADG